MAFSVRMVFTIFFSTIRATSAKGSVVSFILLLIVQYFYLICNLVIKLLSRLVSLDLYIHGISS